METRKRVYLRQNVIENTILFYEHIREQLNKNEKISIQIAAKHFELKYQAGIAKALVELNYLSVNKESYQSRKYKLLHDKQLQPIDVRIIYEHCYDNINRSKDNIGKQIIGVKQLSMTEGNDLSRLKSEVHHLKEQLEILTTMLTIKKIKRKYKYQFPMYVKIGFRKIRVKI